MFIIKIKFVKNRGPTEIRTRVTRFRVLCDSHYTTGPTLKVMFVCYYLKRFIQRKQLEES